MMLLPALHIFDVQRIAILASSAGGEKIKARETNENQVNKLLYKTFAYNLR